jgi:hypothetical protein
MIIRYLTERNRRGLTRAGYDVHLPRRDLRVFCNCSPFHTPQLCFGGVYR